MTIPISSLTTFCNISLDILIQSSSFTYGTPTILRLFFLKKRHSSFNLLVYEWIVDSSIVNVSCREEHIRRNVSVSRFRSMKLFPKTRMALLNCVSMSDSCVFNVSFIFFDRNVEFFRK